MTRIRILGDWGTSRLRLWLVDGDRVIDRADGPGIKRLTDTPAATIARLTARWQAGEAPLLLCGMAGARDGWIEARYADCPADLAGWRAAATATQVDGRALRIAAGLACVNANGGPDVMRGEETQMFGAARLHPDLAERESWFVLPGTHSKWAVMRGGAVAGFTTALTGELFGLLRDHSALVGSAAVDDDPAGFDDGVARIAAAGADQLLALVFETRSRQLRAGKSPRWAASFLSGVLIGGEIAAMLPAARDRIVIVGDAALSARYAAALRHWSVTPLIVDGEAAALHGLLALGDTP